MKAAYIIVTNFCVRRRGMFADVRGPAKGYTDILRPRHVNYRLKLLETICMPSIRSQSSGEFAWILVVDAALDARLKAKLRRAVRPVRQVRLHEYRPGDGRAMTKLGWIEAHLGERPDCVVTTHCDSDDALPRRFVETVRAHVEGLTARGALPLFQIMGTRRSVFWDMLFTREAPLGWARDNRLPHVPSCGFSLLSRYPTCDVSVMGMVHSQAEAYFGNRSGVPHLDVYRRIFRDAARAAGTPLPPPEEAFFDVSSAGSALVSNHGANIQFARLRSGSPAAVRNGARWSLLEGATPERRRVTGGESFPDVAIDWDKARRYARDFSRWRVALRLLEQKLRWRMDPRLGEAAPTRPLA